VGLITIRRNAVTHRGRPKPLYVNLISRSFPKLARAGPGDRARIRGSGHLEVKRFPGPRRGAN
jgi:hypothetical protein